MRHAANQPGTAPAAPARAGHIGGRASLVDKDRLFGVKLVLERGLPMVPCTRHIRALLLPACTVFFKADAVSVVKSPDRTHRHPNPPLCQALADLLQRQIGLL